MNKLSQSTIEKLNYYVYALIDPRTHKVFYVGKGKGSRIYAHVEASLQVDTQEVDKIATIRAIRAEGKEVEHMVMRHGLEENEAFVVEASLIDYIETVQKQPLTNCVCGHDTGERGIRKIQDIEIEYEAKPAEFTDSVVLIRINRLFKPGMTSKALYEATRKHWKVGLRVKKYRYACAVFAGIIREVYQVKEWRESEEVPGRMFFEGRVAQKDVRDRYLHTSVEHLMNHGSQNPIKYIDVSVTQC